MLIINLYTEANLKSFKISKTSHVNKNQFTCSTHETTNTEN